MRVPFLSLGVCWLLLVSGDPARGEARPAAPQNHEDVLLLLGKKLHASRSLCDLTVADLIERREEECPDVSGALIQIKDRKFERGMRTLGKESKTIQQWNFFDVMLIYQTTLSCHKGSRISKSAHEFFTVVPSSMGGRPLDEEQKARYRRLISTLEQYYRALDEVAPDSATRAALAQDISNYRALELKRRKICETAPIMPEHSLAIRSKILALAEKLKGKKIAKAADIEAHADVLEKRLVKLLFEERPGMQTPLMDFLVGADRANYYRNLLLHGEIKIARDGKGYSFDSKSRNYLLRADPPIDAGSVAELITLLDGCLNTRDRGPCAKAEAFAAKHAHPQHLRAYAQAILGRLDAHPVLANGPETLTLEAADRLRSTLHGIISGIDGSIKGEREKWVQFLSPDAATLLGAPPGAEDPAPSLEEKGDRSLVGAINLAPEAREGMKAHGLDDKKKLMALGRVQATDEANKAYEGVQFQLSAADLKQMEDSLKSAREQFATQVEDHASQVSPYFYGKALAKERAEQKGPAGQSKAIQTIADVLNRHGIQLQSIARSNLATSLSKEYLELLATTLDTADKLGAGKETFNPTIQDIGQVALDPKGREKEIVALATLLGMNGGEAADPVWKWIHSITPAEKFGVPNDTFLTMGKPWGPTMALLQAGVEKALREGHALPPHEQHALQMASFLIRSRKHKPEDLFTEEELTALPQLFHNGRQIAEHTLGEEQRKQLTKFGEEGGQAAKVIRDVGNHLRRAGYGLPLAAERALAEFVLSNPTHGEEIIRQLARRMKPADFAKYVGKLRPGSHAGFTEEVDALLKTRLGVEDRKAFDATPPSEGNANQLTSTTLLDVAPDLHYLNDNGLHQARRAHSQAIQELLEKKELSPTSTSLLMSYAGNYPDCQTRAEEIGRKMVEAIPTNADDKTREEKVGEAQGEAQQHLYNCVYLALVDEAALVHLERGQADKVDPLLADFYPDPEARKAHVAELGKRQTERAKSQSQHRSIGLDLAKTAAQELSADTAQASEYERRNVISEWSRHFREREKDAMEEEGKLNSDIEDTAGEIRSANESLKDLTQKRDLFLKEGLTSDQRKRYDQLEERQMHFIKEVRSWKGEPGESLWNQFDFRLWKVGNNIDWAKTQGKAFVNWLGHWVTPRNGEQARILDELAGIEKELQGLKTLARKHGRREPDAPEIEQYWDTVKTRREAEAKLHRKQNNPREQADTILRLAELKTASPFQCKYTELALRKEAEELRKAHAKFAVGAPERLPIENRLKEIDQALISKTHEPMEPSERMAKMIGCLANTKQLIERLTELTEELTAMPENDPRRPQLAYQLKMVEDHLSVIPHKDRKRHVEMLQEMDVLSSELAQTGTAKGPGAKTYDAAAMDDFLIRLKDATQDDPAQGKKMSERVDELIARCKNSSDTCPLDAAQLGFLENLSTQHKARLAALETDAIKKVQLELDVCKSMGREVPINRREEIRTVNLCSLSKERMLEAELANLRAAAGGGVDLDHVTSQNDLTNRLVGATENRALLNSLESLVMENARSKEETTRNVDTRIEIENLINEKYPAIDDEEKAKLLSRELKLREDLRWGKAIALAALKEKGAPPPGPGASDYAWMNWLMDNGHSGSFDDWLAQMTSGAMGKANAEIWQSDLGENDRHLPAAESVKVSKEEALTAFKQMATRLWGEEKERRDELARIEKKLEPIVGRTASNLSSSDLWDWEKARLHLLSKGAPDSSKGQVMSQSEFKELLNAHSRLQGASEHALNSYYHVYRNGEDELHSFVHNRLRESAYKSGTTALNEHSLVRLDRNAASGERTYEFSNFESKKAHYEQQVKDLEKELANNGPIAKLIALQGGIDQGFKRYVLSMGYSSEQTALDSELHQKTDRIARQIQDLAALGSARIKFHGKDTAAWYVAGLLRKELSDLLQLQKTKIDNTILGYEQAGEAGLWALAEAATFGMSGLAKVPAYMRWWNIMRAAKATRTLGVVPRMALAVDEMAMRVLPAAWRSSQTANQLYRYARTPGALMRGWYLTKKAGDMARSAYAMAKMGASQPIVGAAINWGPTVFFHLPQGRDLADKEDKIDDQGRPRPNGIPDWRDHLKMGQSYNFKNFSEAEREIIDKDRNGIPDYYDISEFGMPAHVYTLGSMTELYRSGREGAKRMAMAGPAGNIVGATVLRPVGYRLGWLGNATRVSSLTSKIPVIKHFPPRLIARSLEPMAGMFSVSMSNQLFFGDEKMRSSDNFALSNPWFLGGSATSSYRTKRAAANAGWDSLFMSPIDDWAAMWYLKRNPAASTKALWYIKSFVNHGVIDMSQGYLQAKYGGGFHSATGRKIEDPLYAAIMNALESSYMSQKTSNPFNTQMDLLPKILEDTILAASERGRLNSLPPEERQRMDALLNRKVAPSPQTPSLREIVRNEANLAEYTGKDHHQAFVELFSKDLLNRGVEAERVSEMYQKALAKTGLLERRFGEIKPFLNKVAREAFLEQLTEGKMTAEDLARKKDAYGFRGNFGQHLSLGDAATDARTAWKNPEVEKVIESVAKSYGVDTSQLKSFMLQKLHGNPDQYKHKSIGAMARELRNGQWIARIQPSLRRR